MRQNYSKEFIKHALTRLHKNGGDVMSGRRGDRPRNAPRDSWPGKIAASAY
jgi:hypothetical protein